jgi:hypothetical protein
MSRIDLSKTTATSQVSGLKNYNPGNGLFSVSVPAQNIAAGGFVTYVATKNMDRINSVSQIQIRYTGLDSFWQLVPGQVIRDYPDWTAPNYQVGSFTYFSGSILTVYTYIVNQTGGLVAIPDFIIDCNASLYKAPFNS